MELNANLDHTNGEVSFIMPSLAEQVRQAVEAQAQAMGVTLGEQHPAPDAGDGEGSATDEAGTAAPDAAQPDPDGNLDGLEVCVELSLNGQNFTEDRIYFTYYGRLEPEAMQVVGLPEGMIADAPKEDPKAKKPAKGAVEEPVETVVKPGSKLGCAVAPILQSTFST